MKYVLADSLGVKQEFIWQLIKNLSEQELAGELWSLKSSWLGQRFKEMAWPARPLNFFLSRWRLFSYRRYGYKTLICLGERAKFSLTPLAKLLGWRVIWLELPNTRYVAWPIRQQARYRRQARGATLVCFSLTTKLHLEAIGLPANNLCLIWPGVKATDWQKQADLFQGLAAATTGAARKKFFTIGTIVDLNEPQQTEALFRAVAQARALNDVWRLIVIGDGAARKQAEWLIKKLKLEQAVWLVGEQSDWQKWYANFDVFVVASATPGLDDFLVALGAMISAVPVIAPKDLSLEDCFLSGRAGLLLDLKQVDELMQELINLERDRELWRELSANARRVANDFFSLDRAVADFKKIL